MLVTICHLKGLVEIIDRRTHGILETSLDQISAQACTSGKELSIYIILYKRVCTEHRDNSSQSDLWKRANHKNVHFFVVQTKFTFTIWMEPGYNSNIK